MKTNKHKKIQLQNVTQVSIQWVFNLGSQPFGSDTELSELLRRVTCEICKIFTWSWSIGSKSCKSKVHGPLNYSVAIDYTLTGWELHRDPTKHVANSHKD